MKILMPFVSQNNNTVLSSTVLGGIERFQQLVYQNIDGVIPVNIPKKEKLDKNASIIVRNAIEEHQPDALFTNTINSSLSHGLVKYGIKMIHVHHEPLERSIAIQNVCQNLIKMKESGVSVYFVSQNQYDFFDAQCKRLLKKSLGNITGFINPSYANSDAFPSETRMYNLSTIGRNIGSKDPFWIHRKLADSNLTSLVLTSKPQKYKSDAHNEYVENNSKWNSPRHTFYGLSHSENMQLISQSDSFVSTWPLESWGITALEALNHGIPTILLTDGTNKHASENIAASPDHVVKIKKSAKISEIIEVIDKFKELSHSDRLAIANATKEKHSHSKWLTSVNNMFSDVDSGTGYNPFGTTDLFSF